MLSRKTLIVTILGSALLLVVVGLQALDAAAMANFEANAGLTIAVLEPVQDNTLYEENDTLSNGQGAYLFAGSIVAGDRRRALMKFDVANTLPAEALILSATLKLYVSKRPPIPPSPEPFSLHRATADWGEGASDAGNRGGQGTAAAVGDATWSFSFYSPTSTERISWTNPGGDFLPSASASAMVDQQGRHYTWGPSAGIIADVEHWLAFPDENYGWILLGNEADEQTARRFDSRENQNLDHRPALFIKYLPVQDRQFLPVMLRD